MTRPDRTNTCTACGQTLGTARLTVHDPLGVSGNFCLNAQCYPARIVEVGPPHDARLRWADMESVLGIEGRMRECVAQ